LISSSLALKRAPISACVDHDLELALQAIRMRFRNLHEPDFRLE